MLDRLNFYGIYGYLLPGTVLLSLLWFPFGLLLGSWPELDWKTAGVALVFAYIAGHILHALSEAAFPAEITDDHGNRFYPSDLLVDLNGDKYLPSLTRFGDTVKRQLQERIRNQFDGLDISVDRSLSDEIVAANELTESAATTALDACKTLKTQRRSAFFKCRSYIIQIGVAAYAEQYQAMYALMRGVAAAFVLAFSLYLGLAARIYRTWHLPELAGIICMAALLVALAFALRGLWLDGWRPTLPSRRPEKDEEARRTVFWLIAVAIACGGFTIGDLSSESAATRAHSVIVPVLAAATPKSDEASKKPSKSKAFRLPSQIRGDSFNFMLSLAIVALLLAIICLSAFRTFAAHFAATVYRDFSNSKPPEEKPKEPFLIWLIREP
jgi:hypothetical protein